MQHLVPQHVLSSSSSPLSTPTPWALQHRRRLPFHCQPRVRGTCISWVGESRYTYIAWGLAMTSKSVLRKFSVSWRRFRPSCWTPFTILRSTWEPCGSQWWQQTSGSALSWSLRMTRSDWWISSTLVSIFMYFLIYVSSVSPMVGPHGGSWWLTPVIYCAGRCL